MAIKIQTLQIGDTLDNGNIVVAVVVSKHNDKAAILSLNLNCTQAYAIHTGYNWHDTVSLIDGDYSRDIVRASAIWSQRIGRLA